LLTLIGAEVVEAELAIAQVHTRLDQEGRVVDPELDDRVTQLLVKVAEKAAAQRLLVPRRSSQTGVTHVRSGRRPVCHKTRCFLV
jgi:hypothetical protein